jgi:hypothetical protein
MFSERGDKVSFWEVNRERIGQVDFGSHSFILFILVRRLWQLQQQAPAENCERGIPAAAN